MLPITKWPLAVLTPKHPGFWPSGGVRKGPPSLSQLQDFDSLDGGPIWRARYVEIPVHCPAEVLLAQAIQALALSGVGLFDLPRYPARRGLTARVIEGDGVAPGSPHSDLTPFHDQTLYLSGGDGAAASGEWQLYDSVVRIEFSAGLSGLSLIGGEEFSVRVEGVGSRMHRVMRVLDASAEHAEVEIMPPLRSDVPAGAALDFDDPSLVVRMTNPDQFLQDLTWNRYADLTAEFEEAFF